MLERALWISHFASRIRRTLGRVFAGASSHRTQRTSAPTRSAVVHEPPVLRLVQSGLATEGADAPLHLVILER